MSEYVIMGVRMYCMARQIEPPSSSSIVQAMCYFMEVEDLGFTPSTKQLHHCASEIEAQQKQIPGNELAA